MSSKWIRSRIAILRKNITKLLKDPLDNKYLEEEDLQSLPEAIENIHFPKDMEDIQNARKRLAFDELLSVAFRIEGDLREREKQKSFKEKLFTKEIENFKDSLDFTLTVSQEKSSQEILNDLQKNNPMNRLLNVM